jgi:ribonuclease III
LAELESALGYRFRNRSVLVEALTHRSFTNEATRGGENDNQRLEFFGDAILEFLVSRELFRHHPDRREGELTRLRAMLVDEENLARLAGELKLGGCLRLGRGEERGGGRAKKSMLADAFEALVAAVYLDGGLRSAQRLVERQFGAQARDHSLAEQNRDWKTELQERAQALHGQPPLYRLVETTGPDHARTFRVAVFIAGQEIGAGSGRSKKEAEQAAARQGLLTLAGGR